MGDINGREEAPKIITATDSQIDNGQAAKDVEKQDCPEKQDQTPQYSSFTTWEKRLIVLGAATAAFFSPLTAQIYLPALTSISEDLDVSDAQVNLTVTTYMIFQGITPMFIGSLADTGGRRPAYVICFTIYIGANIGLALTPSYGALLALRCIQSAGSSSTVALCSAIVADVVTSAERGKYIGFTVIPIVLAPALGPVIGGLLSQSLGWRSIFWFLTATSAVTLVLVIFFFPETCRHIVGDGSSTPSPFYRSVWQIIKRRKQKNDNGLTRQASNASKTRQRFKFTPPNVLGSILLFTERGTALLLVTSSIVFAGFYALGTIMPSRFKSIYGYNEIQVGLTYLPLVAGFIFAAFVVGPLINWNWKRHCIRLDILCDRSRQQDLSDFPVERARLEVSLPLLLLGGISLISWGWAVEAETHIAAPCVISAFLAIGMVGFNNTVNALLLDMHPGAAGTATAANNLSRCLVGAGITAAIAPMIDAIGVGWSFTLLGFVYLLCLPAVVLLMTRGPSWRKDLKTKRSLKAQPMTAK